MNIDLQKIKKVHFIGIGGVGISALARLMLHQGKNISGTNDSTSPETLDGLRKKGVLISLDQEPKKLPKADMYVYSDAWLTNNPGILEAAKVTGMPVISYAEALGLVANDYYVIAVSGAHGKTTTTAMLAKVLIDAGFDPTVIVGSMLKDVKSNFIGGKSNYFIVEADEYRRHFMYLKPSILIITNIDDDHLDYYKDINDIKSAFIELVEKISPDGYVVCDLEQPHIADIVAKAKCKIVDYELFGDQNLTLKVPGEHNLNNAAASLAVADILEINRKKAEKSLQDFGGTWRRFEYKGKTTWGAEVYDDYGHHPTEVKATLKGTREVFPHKKITVIFQPHLYSRTKQHLREFGKAFGDVDSVVLTPIFAARESHDSSISSDMLAKEINENHVSAVSFPSIEAVENHIRSNTSKDEVIITMGAGDVYKLAERLVI
ncbi:UDP-N-acetylmuramate--L-alanine ligase [Candidatus Parcubacteria bacterium]|nr:UDP-N-acetylmuramate--L-alanine ligase [Candidatus Parcubacteria bacterium]